MNVIRVGVKGRVRVNKEQGRKSREKNYSFISKSQEVKVLETKSTTQLPQLPLGGKRQ